MERRGFFGAFVALIAAPSVLERIGEPAVEPAQPSLLLCTDPNESDTLRSAAEKINRNFTELYDVMNKPCQCGACRRFVTG